MHRHRIDKHLPVTHQFLGFCGIVPQIGIFNAGVELFQPVIGGFPIHSLAKQDQRFFNLSNGILQISAHLKILDH